MTSHGIDCQHDRIKPGKCIRLFVENGGARVIARRVGGGSANHGVGESLAAGGADRGADECDGKPAVLHDSAGEEAKRTPCRHARTMLALITTIVSSSQDCSTT